MDRRQFLGISASAFALGACTNNATLRTVEEIVDITLGNPRFDWTVPESLPYASITISRSGASRALLLLTKIDNNEMHWTSSDRAVLVTQNGRLTKTIGLQENLLRTEFTSPDYLQQGMLPAAKQTTATRRTIDLWPGNRYAVIVDSRLELAGEESISIGQRKYKTWRYDEHCEAPGIGWRCINSYWLDANGTAWRSRQTIGPRSEPLTVEIAKPYRGS